ncbi:MAG TPA: hypothetical protein VHG51_05495 [Longimicrobiaceae bacterium]|nr:hypothetical protein [Longimicrobiaceae bacterium]
MKADTYAKLVVLEALIDAEVGYYLEHRPTPAERFREGIVARVSDLVDQVDALDAVAAARVYDAIVDFLAELPEDDDGVVEATLRFKRAVDRTVARGMEPRDLEQPSTWAVVLDELLEELADEYHDAVRAGGEVRPREYLRAQFLLDRAREAAERIVRTGGRKDTAELRDGMDRLLFAVRSRRLRAVEVDQLIRGPQRFAARLRPSTLSRVGAFVIGQLLRRPRTRREPRGT